MKTPKTHGCLNTLHPNPRDEFYNLLGSCGGALGGWRAGDQAYQAQLLPLFVCYDLCDYDIQEEEQVEDGNAFEL
ncbi:hypothetical protein Taro_025672 [Colocasia esculenta]|uniref:Uncharacterized protein n=1 Tax=Colocasia esculenta TaxID=4460 RepID=A0A843V9Y8_COLES|nr:hypothetical protein [Colocasia esculenta]